MSDLRIDRLFPDPASDLLLDDAFADLALPLSGTDRPYVAVNMVTSVDGRAQVAGSAEGLGSRVDRRLMRLLRAGFDAVASGAGTVRATGFWSGLTADLAERRRARGGSPQPVSVVIAGSTPVDVERWHAAEARRVLFVGAGNPQQAADGIELLRGTGSDPDPHWVLAELRQRAIGSVLLEGGPTVNAAFLAAEVLDEIFWTVGASLVASDALPMIAALPGGSPWADRPRRGSLVSVHRNGDELFLRYRFG